MVTLKIVGAEGETFSRQFEGSETITVGRSPECDVVLHDLQMARRHCILDINPPKVLVKSDDSIIAGTIYVNGVTYEARARYTVELKDGDEIRLGGSVIFVLISNPAI